MELGLVDRIVREPDGGAHLDHEAAAALLAPVLEGSLAELSALSTADLLAQRYDKFRHMGQFFAPTT